LDAFLSETVVRERESMVDEVEEEVHAVVVQEPEVKDVLVAKVSMVQERVSAAQVTGGGGFGGGQGASGA
jgi:hypothetical protein